MKTSKNVALLGIALAAMGGLFTANVSGVLVFNDEKTRSMETRGTILGHVETTVVDADGNIKEYRQTDNVVVRGGKDCVSKILFADDDQATGQGGRAGTTVCTGANNSPYDSIWIGTSSTAADNQQSSLLTPHISGGFAPQQANIKTWTNATGVGNNAVVAMSKTFTADSALVAREFGLFNNTDTAGAGSGGMFARQVLGADLNVASGDTLTVKWTITLS